MSGDYYVWADEDRLHVWAFDGADGWDDSGWACGPDRRRDADREQAGRVSIPNRVMDEYVMMRLAELIESGRAAEVIDAALRHGNFGGEALAARAAAMKEAFRQLQPRPESA